MPTQPTKASQEAILQASQAYEQALNDWAREDTPQTKAAVTEARNAFLRACGHEPLSDQFFRAPLGQERPLPVLDPLDEPLPPKACQADDSGCEACQ